MQISPKGRRLTCGAGQPRKGDLDKLPVKRIYLYYKLSPSTIPKKSCQKGLTFRPIAAIIEKLSDDRRCYGSGGRARPW